MRRTPCHPLLMVVDETADPPGGEGGAHPSHRLRVAGNSLAAGLMRRRSLSRPSAPNTRAPEMSPRLSGGLGAPLVVWVVGGRGGSGRTALAMDLAWAFGQEEDRRVLLVDADAVSPDIDMALGAVEAGRDLGSCARVDQVIRRLAELQEGRVGLGSCLWAPERASFHCLLAPLMEAGHQIVRREHLDYLMDHFLTPRFDVIVVDAGPITVPPSLSLRFWADWATFALIPTRTGASDLRAALRAVTFLEGEAGLTRDSCCAVSLTEPGMSARRLRAELSAEGIDLHTRRWTQRGASLARARQLPMAAVDRSMAGPISALVEQLGRTRQHSSHVG